MTIRLIATVIIAASSIATVAYARSSDAATASNAHSVVGTSMAAGAIRFSVAPTGNAARYRVREQLMGKDFPNDAIGETSQITGAIVVDSTSGALVSAQSKFVVNTGALKSDSDRRDGYVRGRVLEVEKFPTVELVPTAFKGITAAAVNGAGPVTFDVIGNLTVRGVTRPTTWRVTARQAGGRVTGTAATKFTFADFSINPPRVPILLSVADTIALEYDFTLTRDGVVR
ncbi:MAG: YceI family protein [Gemmatimonadota bacterium]